MGDNIILIGMPGSGKSTVGVVLAKLLGMDFLDVDLVIQSRYGKKLQTLLDELGTEGFLKLEADVMGTLACRNTVIAPGGSAVLREEGALALKKLGRLVYLKVEPQALQERLSNLATRGVAMQPGQTILDVYAQRAPYYEKYADLTIEELGSLERTALQIASVLRGEA